MIHIILEVIGALTVLWWTCGVAIFLSIKMEIPNEIPWSARLVALFGSGFILPWIVFQTRTIPRKGGIIPIDGDNCPCPKCRKRRGEI